MLGGYFPLGKSTIDGRRITALGLMRRFPLALLAVPTSGHAGSQVGTVEGVTVDVDRFGTQLLCTCLFRRDADPAAYEGWYLVPDLDSVRSVFAGNLTTMTGNLIGATLVPQPSWQGQRPVTIQESPQL